VQPLTETLAMITPDAVRVIRSLWLAAEAGGTPATKLDLVRLRASQINACSVCAGTGAGKARQDGETDNRLLDGALAALMLSIATTGVVNRLNVTARPVAGTWGP
jgi:AhpD family alkylhydroperoxidase